MDICHQGERMKAEATYVLVADNARARVFLSDRFYRSLEELQNFAHPEGRLHERDLDSDRHGRQRAAPNMGHHGFGGENNRQQHESGVFAASLTDWLSRQREGGAFEHLVLIAPPHFLGELRKHLHAGCEKQLLKQVDKNLVTERPEEILARLQAERLPKN